MYKNENSRKEWMRKITAILAKQDIETLKEFYDQLRGK